MSEVSPLLPTKKMVEGGAASPATAHAQGLPLSRDSFPYATWATARIQKDRPKLPQSIAHRGFKARYPENTMPAFRAAVEEAGAHAIETDIHLSKDGKVVLSHDADLKRCFNRKERIIDCDWSFLKTIRTTAPPHAPMPLLTDLLTYLAQPQNSKIWVCLDIKLDNNADDVMRLIADALKSVPLDDRQSGNEPNPWRKRVVLGIWVAMYLPLCVKYLPDYPVCYIGFSTAYASKFLRIPNVGVSMMHAVLLGPHGTSFIRKVQRLKRPLFVWTVNDEKIMRWSIQKGVDGVITDDPLRFNQICDEWMGDEEEVRTSWRQFSFGLWLWFVVMLFSVPMKFMFRGTVTGFMKGEERRKLAGILDSGH